MSELTKEKVYKKELIKAGAEGNNNLERIRSLQNGGGSSQKYIVEKVGEDNGNRRIQFTTLTANNNILNFGGGKYNPRYTPSYELVMYSLDNKTFSTRSVLPNGTAINPLIVEFCGMFLLLTQGANWKLIIQALKADGVAGDVFEEIYAVDNLTTYDVSNAFIDGWKMFIVDRNCGLYSIDIIANKENKGFSFENPVAFSYYQGEKPDSSATLIDSIKIGTKIYMLTYYSNSYSLYSFDLTNSTWKKETTLQFQTGIDEKNGCFIGNDYYFVLYENYISSIYKLNLLNLEVTKLDVEGDFPKDSQLFDFNGEIGIAGGTGNNVHFVISKLTPKP